MFVRQTTPNAPAYAQTPASAHSRYPSDASTFSYDDSPNSVLTGGTNITTPPRSPVRQYGQMILPKTRDQDLITEPSAAPLPQRHRRTTSTSSATYAAAYHPYINSRPASYVRRAPSPSEHSVLNTPASVPSPYSAAFSSALNSPLEFGPALDRRSSLSGHARSLSATAGPGHKRSGSASSLDESVLDRFGYPTYRRMPSYISAAATTTSQAPPTLNIVTAFPSAASFGQTEDVGSFTEAMQEYQISDLSPAPAVQYPVATTTTQYDLFPETQPTSSLLEYLTAPNPAPQLVRRVTTGGRVNSHYWWDVRNLRSWTDFSVSKIASINGLMPLLQVPVGVNRLPTPARGSMMPDTELGLHDIWSSHFVTKVNAALQVSLPSPHMIMRSCRPLPGSRNPDFISNYVSDYEKTLTGDVRGRVVGLVKSYDMWNTGMRVGGPNKQVLYLQAFAHLHRIMREHGCRYGFIMNEIELLCVRCGGPPSAASTDLSTVNSNGSIPLFGYLELSAPIRMSTQGSVNPQTGETQMTAGLALWYLHMLAKENPLPDSMGWRMEVGGPSALTRQNAVERDAWIPKPNISEKREAKRLRGWVWPEDPYNRKESGKPKRAKRS